jgi:RimJ/RimL family protein N-acetyltransferase
MIEPARYSTSETLRDGRRIEIRALRPEDRAALHDAVGHLSAETLHRRFFMVKRRFTEKEIDFFVNVDFVNHVALVAEVDDRGRRSIVGGARYVVVEPGTAEVAFAVVDEFQGHGIGAALMRHLATIACDAGLREFIAEVLPENGPMLKVFAKSGLHATTRHEPGVVHVTLAL